MPFAFIFFTLLTVFSKLPRTRVTASGYIKSRFLDDKLSVGILLGTLDKAELFRFVAAYGALPKKTFSMGEAEEKRYYMEARRIR